MGQWQASKVVVTGAGGFIGSHLVEELLSRGAQVTAFLKYNSRNDTGVLDTCKNHSLTTVYGDVCELETVRHLLEGAEVVFHLAALVGIPYSYQHPQEVVDVNTMGTLNVLTAAKDRGVRRLILTSTSEVYGSALYVPIDEKHPKQPQSPYSASKIAADAIAMSFYYAFNLPLTLVRPFNTYGPRQSDRAVIPTIISQALTRQEVIIGNPHPTRDFTFVADTVNGFICAAESDKALGQEINFGSGKEISVGELAAKIGSLVSKEVRIRSSENRYRPEASEVKRLCADFRKAKELTGWQPNVSLEQGLLTTIHWVREHLDSYSPDKYRI